MTAAIFVSNYWAPYSRCSYRLQMLQFIGQMLNPCFYIHQCLTCPVQAIFCICTTETKVSKITAWYIYAK